MTNCYIFILLFLISFTVNAQIRKNSILAGGQLFYYNEKNKVDNFEQNAESGTIGVSLGKALKENSIVGFNFGFSPLKQTNYFSGNDTVTINYKRFDFGIFFREYKKLAKDFYFFGQADGAFITATQTDDYKNATGDRKATQRGGFISLTPGISYKLFKKMQLELTIPNILSMQYLSTKFKSQNPQVKNVKREQFMFYSNLNNNTSLGWLGVGFRFVL